MKWHNKLMIAFLAFAIGAGVGSILILVPSTILRIATTIIIIGIVMGCKGIEELVHDVNKEEK